MQIYNFEQGSPEWHMCRSGVITASNFHLVTERLKSGEKKGEFNSQAHQYAFRLAFERVVGEPLDDTYRTKYMDRGNALEANARSIYSINNACVVESVGFIRKGDFGYSTDGLVDENGSIEIKCFVAPDVLMSIFLNGDLSTVMDQVQGGMWIADREWCDFVLYIPSLEKIGKELTVKRIYRDEKYISDLVRSLREFNGLVEQYKEELLGSLSIEETTQKNYEIRI